MRKKLLWMLGGATALSATPFFQGEARAQQTDVNPPLPNALILLDTSGSMEKMIDGNDPGGLGQGAGNACTYKYDSAGNLITVGNPATGSAPNRWGVAVQALTGDIFPHFTCVEMPRTKNSVFDKEYRINGFSPYDVDYELPYRRPVANGDVLGNACVYAPGALPGVMAGSGVGTPPVSAGGYAADFPANAIKQALLTDRTKSCTFTQTQNGVLDSARDMIRFGLMTFDSDTAAGTGVTAGQLSTVLVANTPNTPFDGMWSYYNGWLNQSGYRAGKPADCATLSPFEVGARNPAAPPWEGRFIMLPSDPNAGIGVVQAQNDQIQKAILAMRPYGATPIAGMLDDARYYFWQDPLGPQATDPYLVGTSTGQGCRDEYIILLTDGAPNMDLRPACAAVPNDPNKPGQCPYQTPDLIARDLAQGGANKHPVKTFVIGFAMNTVNNQQTCSSLNNNGVLDPKCLNVQPSDPLAPCCMLQSIAIEGGTKQAYFADTPGDLQKALGAIIGLIAKNSTTRTVPAYSPIMATPGDPAAPYSAMYLASFTPIPGKPWVGTIQRQRFQCTLQGGSFIVPPPVVDPTQGDDFAVNLNLPGTQANRHFRTVLASNQPAIDSSATIRPYIPNSNPDKVGNYGGTMVGGTPADIRGGLVPQALNITNTSCPNMTNTQYLSANSCMNLALNFTMAEPTTDPMPNQTFAPFQSRYGAAFGDIFHATPTVVPRPSAVIRDESYGTFATLNAQRKTIVYAATNDGLLHAFDAVVNSSNREKGELWAFIPPAVLPRLLSTYPASHQLLLDGAPVARDVIFDRTQGQLGGAACNAQSCPWHTALVAGFGPNAKGYYALDVTDPNPNADMTKGPRFLWQLTSMPKYNNQPDRELFGNTSATPAITTVFIQDNGTTHEVGVAILPGGSPGPAQPGSCPRAAAAGNDAAPLVGFSRRDSVRCWASSPSAPVPGRSVTVVRLDTGEILRVFGRKQDLPQALIDANRVGAVETPLDSPMTGVPVVYPNQIGSVAEKFFVGDADGTIWRFDLTSKNPAEWTGELYLDAYNTTTYSSNTSYMDGQPIQLAPTLSIDTLSRPVLHFATGDQETFTTSGTNFVYSITETPQQGKLRANVNWYLKFINGERVSGPMTVFDSTLYFATFAAGGGTNACSGGSAKLWGRDYVTPKNKADLSEGGVPRLQPPVNPPPQPPDYIDPASYDPNTAGKVIPGVSVNVTPACAATSTYNDTYTGGLHTQFDNVSQGSYSLFTPVGGKNQSNNNGTSIGTFKIDLPQPRTTTIIDAWASVVE